MYWSGMPSPKDKPRTGPWKDMGVGQRGVFGGSSVIVDVFLIRNGYRAPALALAE